ncbi:hypothetical protein VTL71DRAFT_7904, partial [Oculimacula yallundae]
MTSTTDPPLPSHAPVAVRPSSLVPRPRPHRSSFSEARATGAKGARRHKKRRWIDRCAALPCRVRQETALSPEPSKCNTDPRPVDTYYRQQQQPGISTAPHSRIYPPSTASGLQVSTSIINKEGTDNSFHFIKSHSLARCMTFSEHFTSTYTSPTQLSTSANRRNCDLYFLMACSIINRNPS